MEILDTIQQFVIRQKAEGSIDDALTLTKISDIWDCLLRGDDNSEDESKLGLFSDMTVWTALSTVSKLPECPELITIEHSRTGEWRRTTWVELVTAARNKIKCNE